MTTEGKTICTQVVGIKIAFGINYKFDQMSVVLDCSVLDIG